VSGLRLLAGPDLRSGAESLTDHTRRLGAPTLGGRTLIETLVRSGVGGRGGASFPAGMKWRAVASASKGPVVVIANGAEGEPQSHKDRLLMATRPHLILDGAFLAARTLRAAQVVIYVGEEHKTAWAAMTRAVEERPEAERRITRMVGAPNRYVAGESSAAVHLVDAGVATPTTTPPFPRERGVAAVPTLVQNVETLAHIALIARYGDAWYRSVGRRGAAGTVLLTIAGGVKNPGVLEVEAGTTIEEVVAAAGGVSEPAGAVLLGGYFGVWVPAAQAWELPLDGETLRSRGMTLGCGVIGVQPAGRCGVCDTARIMRYLAEESSAQCGPCFFGLRALSDACNRLAERGTNRDDIARLNKWAVEVPGRGACKHPDGAVMFLRSALYTFSDQFASHPAHWRQQPA
jgi:NADH:ubiquinone oxidoreductase subunit F (NADH-binding)